jgi:uncharacterized protein YkwD
VAKAPAQSGQQVVRVRWRPGPWTTIDEPECLIAIAIYFLIGWAIVALIRQQPVVAAQGPRPAPPAIVVGSTQQALINQDRAGAGLGPLTWNGCLAGIAYQNAVRMANAGAISHAGGATADLGCGLGRQGGENVGYWSGGIDDGRLNGMFLASPGHRANIMGPYRYVGTSWVVAKNGYAYIAVEFS